MVLLNSQLLVTDYQLLRDEIIDFVSEKGIYCCEMHTLWRDQELFLGSA